jgi:hypothetical protein
LIWLARTGAEHDPGHADVENRQRRLHHRLGAFNEGANQGRRQQGRHADAEEDLVAAVEFRMADRRQDHRAQRAHGARLGRRGHAQHHGAQHHEDQHGGRHDALQALLPQFPAARAELILRRGRQPVRLQARQDEGVQREQADLHQRRAPGAQVHAADVGGGGLGLELIGQHHQHQGRRHQLGDGAGSRQHAGGIAHVVAIAHHDRQRNHGHGDHLRRHGAGDGAEDEADDDHRVAQAPAHAAEQASHGVQHVLGQPAFLQHRAHEGEEGDRQQQVVGQHAAEDPLRHRLQEGHAEEAFPDRDETEEQPDRQQRERHREADQHEHNQAAEHQRRHHFQWDHCTGLSYLLSRLARPAR